MRLHRVGVSLQQFIQEELRKLASRQKLSGVETRMFPTISSSLMKVEGAGNSARAV